MMFRTHIIFALFFYLLFIKIFSIEFSLIFTFILAFGSILPDIDHPKSFVNRRYLLGIGKSIAVFSKHRGFWHSIYGLMIFAIFSVIVVSLFGISFLYALALPLGYFLHLAADSFNVSGIKWLWKSGHVRWRIKTGKMTEQIFFFVFLIATVYIIIGSSGTKTIIAFVLKIFG